MTTTSDPAAVGMNARQLDRLAPAMQQYIDSGEIVGINTLVARRGEVVYRNTQGHLDREADTALSSDAIYRIYSMTKPVVSTALMLLFDEGKFLLEQPLMTYLPEFAAVKVMEADGTLVDPVRPPTIGDALAHTAGLTYDFMVDNPVAELYRQHEVMHDASRTLAECIEVAASLPLAFQPGTKWHYSIGIDVAGRLVEVLSGQSLGDFMAERLFGPLGMVDTGFGVEESKLGRLSAMYGLPDLVGKDYHAGGLMEAAMAGFNERIDVSATYPTGTPDVYQRGGVGLFSTIDDYFRFAQMLANGGTLDGERIIGRKTLELMHTNRITPELLPIEIMGMPIAGHGFGLGSRVLQDVGANAGPGSVGEFGWAGAAKTYFWVDPVEELVGVFMSQYMTGIQTPDRTFRNVVYAALDA